MDGWMDDGNGWVDVRTTIIIQSAIIFTLWDYEDCDVIFTYDMR